MLEMAINNVEMGSELDRVHIRLAVMMKKIYKKSLEMRFLRSQTQGKSFNFYAIWSDILLHTAIL